MRRPEIKRDHLPYVSALETRASDSIDLVVIHCTELPDLARARTYGERIIYPDSGTGNSGHYYIERSGHIEEWVPPTRVAHHVRGCNQRSIGIELVNLGRYPDWFDSRKQSMTEPYPEAQIKRLVELLEYLMTEIGALKWIAGHAELDTARVAAENDPDLTVQRKVDPGPLFPWERVLSGTRLKSFKV